MSAYLDPLRPYATAIKWGLAVLLAFGLFGSGLFVGCDWQQGRDAKKLAAADKAIDLRTDALHAAATSLRKARNTFQDISHRTRESADAAEAVLKQGQAIARQAAQDRVKHQHEIDRLERELQNERSKCTEGRAKICGTPLR